MKAKSTLLTLVLLIVAFSNITAQVTAGFSMNNSKGCSPLVVSFTNESTGIGTLTYAWDFGDGNTSTNTNPQKSYSVPGNYTVKLTVSNGTVNNSITKTVTVYKNPTASFTASKTKACIPVSVDFKDASTPGSTSITKWNWDFRNGTVKTEQNPSNYYDQAGKYGVFLEVTDGNGCHSASDKTAFIDVVDKPTVSFNANPSNSCTVPANIQFKNQSTGGGNLTYLWDFGGGSTSALKDATHTYNNFGTYNVKLTVTSDYGCTAFLDAQSVVIGEVIASGTLSQYNKNIQNNSTVCAGLISFKNTSAGNTTCKWDFGDGTNSFQASGDHAYPTAGTFKIKLIAAPGSSCADTVLWNVTVEKAVAGFNLTPASSCKPSTSVALTNQSSANIVSYKWEFPDGSTSVLKDDIKVFTEPVDKDPYVIHQNSAYPVKLVATSTNACKDSITKYINVLQPTALFTASSVNGCAPLTVNFLSQSQSSDPITDKVWQWGEGTPQTTSQNLLSHTYNNPGTYNVKLVVNTVAGCKDTSYSVTINVGKKITPDFSVNNAITCSSQKIGLNDLSPAGNYKYHYTINGKNVPACPDIANPLLFLKTDTGALPVKLIIDQNGCYSEVTKNILRNDGPVCSFDFTVDCSSDRTVLLKGKSKKATGFKWDFGDSQVNTTDLDITHTYAVEGNFTVKFISINGACSDTFIRIVKIRDHQPEFTMKTEECAYNPVYVNCKKSHKLSDSCKEKYLWDFGDNSQQILTSKDSVGHTYLDGGMFAVKLYAIYDDGCRSTISKSVRIYKPVPNFSTDKSKGCTPLAVTFTDNSAPDVHPINFWEWTFGTGQDTSYYAKVASVKRTFNLPAVYTVTLKVSDDFGCIASFNKDISTALPTADFFSGNAAVCSGTEVGFYIQYPDPDSAIWNFGNGKLLKSSAVPTLYTYPDSGKYDVTLTVYKYGCSRTQTNSKYMDVQKANARFTVSDSVFNCYPKKIDFTHTAGSKNILSGNWLYGHENNSSPSYSATSSYNYPKPGSYRAKLQIQTTYGCTDTFSRLIKITGPAGFFEVTPQQACKGDEVTYKLTDTSNVYKFEWDLGDGSFAQNNPVVHKYKTVGNKTARLILYGGKIDGETRCMPPAVEQTILIHEVVAGIGVVDTSVCEGTTIQFTNSSTGINSSHWDFGDGTTSTTESPQHLLNTGTYKVSLEVSSAIGCKDTAVQYMVVSAAPSLRIGNDTTICLGQVATLKANSNQSLLWIPSESVTSPTSQVTTANPLQTVYYKAIATDDLSGCYTKDSLQVTVQQVPVVDLEIEADHIIKRRPIQVTVNTEEGAHFEWIPTDFLSCTTCNNPILTASVNTSYVLKVTDKNNCFTIEKPFAITVEEGSKDFDVPTAFTPEGAENNRIFKIEGFNIKEVLEFKIYNRWGNLVFSSTDQSKGWDGYYQGKAQPVDTYVYTIKIKTFEDKIESKTGTILLLR